MKRAACTSVYYEETCFDQCFRMHCTTADELGPACGDGKSFQDCAECCGSNNNQISGCFRRRRRLSSAVEAEPAAEAVATSAQASPPDAFMGQNDCAINCLNTPGCIGFLFETGGDLTKNKGVCSITKKCDWSKKSEDGFVQGKWWVRRGIEAADLTSKEPKSAALKAARIAAKRKEQGLPPAGTKVRHKKGVEIGEKKEEQ